MERVNKKLRRLALMQAAVFAALGLAVGGFAGFSLYSNTKLNSSLDQQEQVIAGLCDSLTRAGIIFAGSEKNPCES